MSQDVMESLYCYETGLLASVSGVLEVERVCKAICDPVIVNDKRVLTNLLDTENQYIPSCSYFKCVQNEIKPPMRRILAYWMVEVCEEQRCQEDVFPLSMNLLDRFLSVANVRKDNLQLLGAVCLFIASKLRETCPLTAKALVRCTDDSITVQDIIDWELLVLHRLRWDVSAVTPYDFLSPLLQRLPLQRYLPPTRQASVGRQAQTFMVMCATEYKFTMCSASMVAGASVAAAIYGLLVERNETTLSDIFEQLNRIVSVETDLMRNCWQQIEEMISQFAAEQSGRSSRPESIPADHHKPGASGADTPVDISEVHF